MKKILLTLLIGFTLYAGVALSNTIEKIGSYMNVIITGSDGAVIGITRNSVDMHDSDVHWERVTTFFKKDSATTSLLTSPATAGTSTIVVTDSTLFTAGNYITITEGSIRENDIRRVISSAGVPSHILTLASPLEQSYTTAAIVTLTSIDMGGVVGSIASPIIYETGPPSDEVWHITNLSIVCADPTDPTVDKFCGLTALTNGVVMRMENGVKENLFNIRTNMDLYQYFGDNIVKLQKSGGGDWMLSAMWHMKEHTGSIVRLNGATGDKLRLIIQDALTGQDDLFVVALGHKEGA